jgi:hypothetical protein
MSCSLCTDSIDKSGSLRPNVATFDCGHEFHLSCILKYSKENISMSCPSCTEIDPRAINLGEDRMIALQSLVDSRRSYVENNSKGFLSWFTDKSVKSMVRSGTSLETLKLKGVKPEDLIEERVDWDTVSKIYKTGALLDFGFRWHHMITMGFQPDHFKLLNWQQMTDTLKLSAVDMLKTSITIRQLAELKIDIAHLHELGFRLKELKQIGGNCETMKLLTSDLGDLKTYFSPSANDWDNLGFTKENIEKYGWQSEEYTPVRKTRQISLAKGRSGFVF